MAAASRTGRLVLVTTSGLVAPGQLTYPAWQALTAAERVLTATADHPQLPFVAEAGVAVEVVARDAAAVLAAAAERTVVWLAAPSGEEDLLRAIGERVVAGAGPEIEVIPGSYELPGSRVLELIATMDTLRTSCPWDAKQTHQTLGRYLIEEAYETLEAIEEDDLAGLREELGDVLLQVAFHARVAQERTDGLRFDIDDVAAGIVAKLVRRHPHVFADVEVAGAEEVSANWDAIKSRERADRNGSAPVSALDGVPFAQGALTLAAELQRRAERAEVDAGLFADPDGGFGAELFALVERARARGIDAEEELRAAARRFRDRVQRWEATVI